MRLQVGGVYQSRDGLVYACVQECEAETVRFKEKGPGYKLLMLDGPAAGAVIVVPRGANVTVSVTRLD